MLFHIYKCRRFRKSNQKRAPELGIPAEWPHSEVSGQTSVKLEKLNEMGKWIKGNPLIMNFRNHRQKFFDVILLYICKYVKFRKSYKKIKTQFPKDETWCQSMTCIAVNLIFSRGSWPLSLIGQHCCALHPTADCGCAKWGKTFPQINRWHNLDFCIRNIKWTHSTSTNFSFWEQWLGTNVPTSLRCRENRRNWISGRQSLRNHWRWFWFCH